MHRILPILAVFVAGVVSALVIYFGAEIAAHVAAPAAAARHAAALGV